MCRLDALGISDAHKDPDVSKHPVFFQFHTAVHKNAGRYIVLLMIKAPGKMSSTNRTVAEGRLKGQLQRFEHKPELLQECDAVISKYLTEGHAERVYRLKRADRLYYLPHHV